MSTVNFATNETGTTTEYQSTTGAFVSVTNTVAYSGTYSLRSNPTTTSTGSARLTGLNGGGGSSINAVNITDSYVRFYFRYATKPASNDEVIFRSLDGSSTVKLSVTLNSSGILAAKNTSGTVIATGSTVLAANTWYRIDVRCGTGASAVWEVRINGISEITTSNANLGTNGAGSQQFGKAIDSNGNTVDFYYDTILWSDSGYPSPGANAIAIPVSNGTAQTFTIGAGSGSHWQIVNPIPSLGDSSYLVSTAVNGNAETEFVQSAALASISGVVNCVRAFIVVKQDGASQGLIAVRVISNGTTLDASGTTTTNTSYASKSLILDTDPATSASWGLAAFSTLQVGCRESTSGNKSRLTSVYALVDFNPSGLFRSGNLSGIGSGGKFFQDLLGG